MRKRGPYEFNSDDALRFAAEQMAQTRRRGDELQFKECPYCRSAGKGDQYSFSINLKNGLYKCLRASCGASGNMIQLARDFRFDLGDSMEYYERRKTYRNFKLPERPIQPKDAAVKYMESRGISAETTKTYEITTKKGDNNVLVFPFYNQDRTILPLVKYRAIKVTKNKEWYEAGCQPILFGMNHCEPAAGPLVITEGQIDSLSVAEAGIKNAVSVPGGAKGFTWVPYCWDFVNQFEELIIFGDHEHGHITLLDEITRRFGKNHIIRHVMPEDYKDCKDANDILRKYGADQVRKCVKDAQVVPMKALKDLADVKAPTNVEKLETGIHPLDTLLHGGLPFGMYHVIAGKRGNGKSTLASQIFARAIDQGYVCMAYSGEMNDYNFKFWLDCQLAGSRNIIEDPRTVGKDYNEYLITASTQDRINDWYRGRVFMYDNTVISGVDENTGLLDVIDDAIRRYGVRVILLDNLMTAMYRDDMTDRRTEYERQGQFSARLAEIAQETGTLILLVAHKRKESAGGTDEADDVAGNSQTTNYAGVVVSYNRYSEKEIKDSPYLEASRKLLISKNRLYGAVNTSGICLYFDEKSRRIWTEQRELIYQYGWEKVKPMQEIDTREISFE